VHRDRLAASPSNAPKKTTWRSVAARAETSLFIAGSGKACGTSAPALWKERIVSSAP
jgi:hypothetical protein